MCLTFLFQAIGLGVVTGVWRRPLHHGTEAALALRALRGPVPSGRCAAFAARRCAVGLPLVVLLRAVSKELLKRGPEAGNR